MRALPKAVVFVIIMAIVTTACAVPTGLRVIRGSGDITLESRDVSGFDRISMAGAGRIILTQGDTESLTVETDDNLMEYIETKVVGDTLEIGFTDEIVLSRGGQDILEPSEGFIFRISVIDLGAIKVSGAADIQADKLKTDRLVITFSGAGDINIDDLNADNLEVFISGAGNVDLTGKVISQYVTLSGVGRYAGSGLESQEASVTISGVGGAKVWVTETLDVVISGAGDVEYYGSPSVHPEISGLGRLNGLGDK